MQKYYLSGCPSFDPGNTTKLKYFKDIPQWIPQDKLNNLSTDQPEVKHVTKIYKCKYELKAKTSDRAIIFPRGFNRVSLDNVTVQISEL